MADMYGRVSKTKERIQNTDQKILTESELCKEFTLEHENEVAACQEIRDKVEETAKQLKNYQHDTELIKLQLKDKMHDVEKILQQGKLVTMGEVKSEIKSRYKGELDMRNKVIHKQKQVKEMIAAHEHRVQELTVQLQKQYDPNLDSPRRNELKRKAAAFEEVFDTMMKRIGESDITRIVEMFQKQSLTHQAWTEAVRDQEIRVKALQVPHLFSLQLPNIWGSLLDTHGSHCDALNLALLPLYVCVTGASVFLRPSSSPPVSLLVFLSCFLTLSLLSVARALSLSLARYLFLFLVPFL